LAVPTLEQTVFPEQGPLPQANAADFGGQVGEAQANVGVRLSDAGDVMAKHVLAWQGLKNEATAQDLNVSFQSDLGKLETQFYGLKGKQQADAYPAFETQVQALRQQYLGRAGNPMVANMLGGTLGQSVGYTLRSAGRQAGAATKDWMIQSAAGHADMLTYQAQSHYNDPTYVATAKEGIKASIQNYGELQGWSQDTIDLKVIEQNALLDKGIQDAAKSTLNGLPVTDAAAALLGGAGATKPGEVGGQAYKLALVRTEFGSGKDTPGNPHQGPVQADDAWLAHFGSGKPRDQMTLQDWMDATDKETVENKPKLEAALGRKVTDADLYLAHQQGEAGAEALLKNPDALAKDVVSPANLEANIPKHPDGSPIVDPNKITAGQFAAIWSKGFISQSGIAGQPSMASQQALDAAAALNPENRQAMAKDILSALNSQDAAARAQTNFEQEQQAKAKKQQYDTVVGAAKAAVEANWADPAHAPAVDFGQLAQTQFFKENPDALTAVMDYRKALARPAIDAGISAQNTSAMFGKLFPSDGSPPATQNDIDQGFINGDFNREDHDWLTKQLTDAKDPTAQRTNGQLNDIAKYVERQIDPSFDGSMGTSTHSPFSGTRMLQWKQAVADKIAAFKAAGKDPAILFDPTPSNKDYVGSAGFIAPYTRTLTDLMTEEATGQESQPAVAATTPEATPTAPAAPAAALPEGIPEGSTYAGTSKTDGSPLYRLPKALGGGLVRVGAPSAPVAAAGPPEVPSGE